MRHKGFRILILLIVMLSVAVGVWIVVHHDIMGIQARSEKRTPSLSDFQALPYLAHVEDERLSGKG